MAAGMGKPHDICNWRCDHSRESLESPDSIGSKRNLRERKGTSLNSDSLAPKPLASSVFVRVAEARCPHKRSMSVMFLFPSLEPTRFGWELPRLSHPSLQPVPGHAEPLVEDRRAVLRSVRGR